MEGTTAPHAAGATLEPCSDGYTLFVNYKVSPKLVVLQTESESGSEHEKLEDFRLANIKDRPPIFDADALHDLYEDLAWETPEDWTQLQVTR